MGQHPVSFQLVNTGTNDVSPFANTSVVVVPEYCTSNYIPGKG